MSETRLTPRKQRFASLVASGLTASEAARQAGYADADSGGARSIAHRLMKDPKVRALVDEQLAALRERNESTADSMVKQFDEDRAFAVSTQNASAAVRASEMKAKLAGLLIDRADVRTLGGFVLRIEGIERGSPAD